jgi:hypothetical protein
VIIVLFLCLQTICVTRLGHRRRILASLKQPSSGAKGSQQTTSGKEENWPPTSSAADRERHRDFVEIDQLMVCILIDFGKICLSRNQSLAQYLSFKAFFLWFSIRK